jgi:hypothetical protein
VTPPPPPPPPTPYSPSRMDSDALSEAATELAAEIIDRASRTPSPALGGPPASPASPPRRAVSPDEGRALCAAADLFIEAPVGSREEDKAALRLVAAHLLGRALGRRGRELSLDRRLMALDAAASPGLLVEVDPGRLRQAIAEAAEAGASDEMLAPARAQHAALIEPPWWNCAQHQGMSEAPWWACTGGDRKERPRAEPAAYAAPAPGIEAFQTVYAEGAEVVPSEGDDYASEGAEVVYAQLRAQTKFGI